MSRPAGWCVLAFVLAACNFSPAPEATATISPDQVLQTAQAIAEATLAAVTPTVPPTPVPPTETPVLETATPEATATPGSPMLTADYNANVRYGPGEEYPVIDFLLGGQSAAIVGRYDDTPIGTWWLIERPDLGQNGWIWDGAVTVAGSTAGVVVQQKPPTPTPTKGPSRTPGPTAAATDAPTEPPTVTSTP